MARRPKNEPPSEQLDENASDDDANLNDSGQLDDRFIIKRIQSYLEKGINSDEGEVTDVRQDMFSRYMGAKYGNERPGFSQIVTRQIFEAIEWALPPLMRVFLGGTKALEFAPTGPNDVAQAKLETDAVNYWFYNNLNGDSGFVVLYTWLKDLLMYPNGYVTVSIIEESEENNHSLEGVTAEQIQQYQEDDGAEVEITKQYAGTDQTGQPVDLHDVEVTSQGWNKSISVDSVPPDQLIVAHHHRKLNLDGSPFVALRLRKTRSDLLQMGFNGDDLTDLGPDEADALWTNEEVTRYFYTDEDPQNEDSEFALEADEEFWYHECYMQIDVDGDGINELRKIVMVGCKVLSNEPLDYMPSIAGAAIVNTHRHIGMGYAEIVADLQELYTQLTRQLLDNVYKHNISRAWVSESAMLSDNRTMDAILDGDSEVIPTRGNPNEAVYIEQTTPIVQEIGGVLQQLEGQVKMRTGVAPELSLDPDTLQKATMGAFVGALDQASQRLELLARLFAETALKPLFQKIHFCLRNYFDGPQQIEVDGAFQTVDPSKWKKRSNMKCNVGLGFNNRQIMLGMLGQLLQMQMQAQTMGLADAKGIYNTLSKMIEAGNVGSPGSFFINPNDPNWKAPQPQPDAQMISAQASMVSAQAQSGALQAEAKRKDAELKAKIALDNKTADAKIAADKEKAALDGTNSTQSMIEFRAKQALIEAQIAQIHATITSLNRADKNQGGPAEDSSADEFQQARSDVSGKAA